MSEETMQPRLDFEEADSKTLRVRRVSVREAMNDVFVCDVIARSRDENIDLSAIVGKGAGLGALSPKGPLAWTGICNHMEMTRVADATTGRSTYWLRIVPPLWLLTQRTNYRIFQHESVPSIVQKVLEEYEIFPKVELEKSYPKLEYKVQYGETDFAFVNRLLEEAGISYFYGQRRVGAQVVSELIFNDKPTQLPSLAALPYYDTPNEGQLAGLYITDVHPTHVVKTGTVTKRDWSHRKPRLRLLESSEWPLEPGESNEGGFEHYAFEPGGSLVETTRATDVLAVADSKSIARHLTDEVKRSASLTADALRRDKQAVGFRTKHPSLNPGSKFTIEDHPRSQLAPDKELMVIESNVYITELDWTRTGRAVFASRPYAPEQRTPRPRVKGVQTAIVCGPRRKQIYTDELGRVRVRFHWDREGAFDDQATCWLRTSQAWAGRDVRHDAHPARRTRGHRQFLRGQPRHAGDQRAAVQSHHASAAQVARSHDAEHLAQRDVAARPRTLQRADA